MVIQNCTNSWTTFLQAPSKNSAWPPVDSQHETHLHNSMSLTSGGPSKFWRFPFGFPLNPPQNRHNLKRHPPTKQSIEEFLLKKRPRQTLELSRSTQLGLAMLALSLHVRFISFSWQATPQFPGGYREKNEFLVGDVSKQALQTEEPTSATGATGKQQIRSVGFQSGRPLVAQLSASCGQSASCLSLSFAQRQVEIKVIILHNFN